METDIIERYFRDKAIGWIKPSNKKRRLKHFKNKELGAKRVDQKILPYILELMKFDDIVTTQSCAGHPRHDKRPSVSFIFLQCTPEKADLLWKVILEVYSEVFGDDRRSDLRAEFITTFNGQQFRKTFTIYALTDKRDLCFTTLIRKLNEAGFSKGKGLEVENVELSVFDVKKGQC